MANLRQTILIRTDLDLSPGLISAQVAHIHAESMRQILINKKSCSTEFVEWLKDPYIFVHGVGFVELLNNLLEKAKSKELPVSEWYDTITIKVGGNGQVFSNMLVGGSIGPADSDLIKSVIGNLPLLS